MRDSPTILDIGGEGRHPEAWNLNPRRHKTFGPERGQLIPRWIEGRGERIPLPDRSVDVLIVERTPLLPATLVEIARVASPTARIILRHVPAHHLDPHRLAVEVLSGKIERGTITIGSHRLQETVICRVGEAGSAAARWLPSPFSQWLMFQANTSK
jgi:ubiquinone/menaquinone biosynthesis C-methylase UbiE